MEPALERFQFGRRFCQLVYLIVEYGIIDFAVAVEIGIVGNHAAVFYIMYEHGSHAAKGYLLLAMREKIARAQIFQNVAEDKIGTEVD